MDLAFINQQVIGLKKNSLFQNHAKMNKSHAFCYQIHTNALFAIITILKPFLSNGFSH